MRVVVGLKLLDRTVSLVQCGLVLILFVFSTYFGLSWRNYAFGSGLGLGIFASVQLGLVTLMAHVGMLESVALFDIVGFVAYDSCVLIWRSTCWHQNTGPTAYYRGSSTQSGILES